MALSSNPLIGPFKGLRPAPILKLSGERGNSSHSVAKLLLKLELSQGFRVSFSGTRNNNHSNSLFYDRIILHKYTQFCQRTLEFKSKYTLVGTHSYVSLLRGPGHNDTPSTRSAITKIVVSLPFSNKKNQGYLENS